MTGNSPYLDAMKLLRSIRDELELLTNTPGWTHALLESRVGRLATEVREAVTALEPGMPSRPNTDTAQKKG